MHGPVLCRPPAPHDLPPISDSQLMGARRCLYVFCSLCDQSYHPGTRCMSPEAALQLLRERAHGNKNAAAQFFKKVLSSPPSSPFPPPSPRLRAGCADSVLVPLRVGSHERIL